MGLNDKATSERVHIGFFGLRNAGKSSVVNAVTGQSVSVVSDVKGTTTDAVEKSMELLPIGPVVIIDTPGIDDSGELGDLRVKRTKKVLNKTDIAVLVVDAQKGMSEHDISLKTLFEQKEIPYVIAYNKSDMLADIPAETDNEIYVSAKNGTNIYELKEKIGKLSGAETNQKKIVGDIIEPGDNIVLVVPIDSSAPKGRLILPQQQTIRDILDSGAIATVTRDTELKKALSSLADKPKLVITDSQAFGKVGKDTPEDILLTSFSILFARYKGDLLQVVKGAAKLGKLQDGDTVLISEGCTHHRQCNDIGTVKLPGWIKGFCGKDINFEFTSGGDFPEDLSKYALIVHCGGCMLNEREMKYRIRHASDNEIPITNYGIAIAHIHGLLKRSLSPFPEIQKELD
ncbi:MAG: [FeFe] hydrogenase H-cluster maturation GTPase HydF [Clostridia bacterium]|nr:[FeFe] hydrogenase H-cluster maturation GTPase HydF [Clostridia bacterium]